MQGPHPMENFGKKYEAAIAAEVREAYQVQKNQRVFIINTINDPTTRMGTQILSCKLMRISQAATVPAYVIRVVGQCAKGGYLN